VEGVDHCTYLLKECKRNSSKTLIYTTERKTFTTGKRGMFSH